MHHAPAVQDGVGVAMLTDVRQGLSMLNTLANQTVSFSDDPAAAYFYLYKKRQSILDSVNQRPLLRLWDTNHQLIGTIGKEQSVQVEEVMADSGTANCVIRQDNWLSNFILYDRRAEQDLHFTLDPYPTNRSWRTRWGGKVTTVHAKRDSSGLHTVELEMIHNREHLKHLLIGANPVFPPEIQIPKMYFLPWNCRTGVFMTLFINLARQFFPLLSIPDNIANPFGWIGVDDSLGGLDPLLWPIQPQFLDPATDQSRFEVIAARWNDAHTVTLPVLTDAGCQIRAYTFIAGEDTESPHPELGNMLGKVVMPERNCIILAAEDKSGTTGPSGTLADGWIKFIASSGDDLITDTIVPDPNMFPDTQVPSGIYPLIQTWFGVAPDSPWIVFKDDEYSGIIESTRSQHGATAKTVMTGGKSPGWVCAPPVKVGGAQTQSSTASTIYRPSPSSTASHRYRSRSAVDMEVTSGQRPLVQDSTKPTRGNWTTPSSRMNATVPLSENCIRATSGSLNTGKPGPARLTLCQAYFRFGTGCGRRGRGRASRPRCRMRGPTSSMSTSRSGIGWDSLWRKHFTSTSCTATSAATAASRPCGSSYRSAAASRRRIRCSRPPMRSVPYGT